MVDVCLVVEGSYPYITGGVSAWTDGLLSGLPDVSFTVAHVRDAEEPSGPAAYVRPANAGLIHVDLDPDEILPADGAHLVLPEARVYHAACTGAASELARRAAAEHGGGFALTEHGLAWREVEFGITGCGHKGRTQPLTGCGHKGRAQPLTGCGHKGRAPGAPRAAGETTREIVAAAVRAYAEAGAVTSVCGPNARAQRTLGAERAFVIPNPVSPGPERTAGEGFLAAFVGRVVAIKDVLTFLEACAKVAELRTDARFAVVGPTDHEPDYAEECRELAARLGIAERVTFTGATDPRPWFAAMDALVLTSVSEAQPLVALEAMAAGVPVVATDVGGCREAIGDAGLLTPTADPAATAAAMLRLAGDDLLRARLGAAGRRRTAIGHDPARVYGAYREMYERLAA